jgi:hypothetical protein
VLCRLDINSTSGTIQVFAAVYSSSAGLGTWGIAGSATASSIFVDGMAIVTLATAQTIWYNVSGANMNVSIYVHGWEY